MHSRFDIVTAWYFFLSEYHEGQSSDKYKRLSKLIKYFKPGPIIRLKNYPEAQEIYDGLVAKHIAANMRT